jgi:hypothetical protein
MISCKHSKVFLASAVHGEMPKPVAPRSGSAPDDLPIGLPDLANSGFLFSAKPTQNLNESAAPRVAPNQSFSGRNTLRCVLRIFGPFSELRTLNPPATADHNATSPGMSTMDAYVHVQYLKEEEFLETHYETADVLRELLGQGRNTWQR